MSNSGIHMAAMIVWGVDSALTAVLHEYVILPGSSGYDYFLVSPVEGEKE
jgi:hypothetical protein